jgi:AcrR family transcriptional regulator
VGEQHGSREELKEKRRRQIIDAATQVFADRGFHAANVSDVAAHAGVSQGTIYWYFESKDALFAAVLEQATFESTEPLLALAERQEGEPLSRIMHVIRQFLAQIQRPPDSFRLLVNLWTQPGALSGDRAGRIVRDLYRTLIDGFLTGLIQEAMDADQIAEGDAGAIALVLVTVLDGLMFQSMLIPDLAVDMEAVEQALMRLLCGPGGPTGPSERCPASLDHEHSGGRREWIDTKKPVGMPKEERE